MKKLNSGDTLIFPNGKRVTVRNVREGANGEMFCDFHEISCDWTVHQLSVMGCFDDVLTQQWRGANRHLRRMADIAIGLLNQTIADGFIEAGTPHNWVEVSDEPAKKICVASSSFLPLKQCLEYQYYERVSAIDGYEFAVTDGLGKWYYFDREDFERYFTIKQPNQ